MQRLKSVPVELEFHKGYVATPEEYEIVKKRGYARDEVERLGKEDGHMTEDEYYEIIPIHRMIEQMRRRYHVEFEPGRLTCDGERYTLEVTALSGPAAGRAFIVTVRDVEGSCLYSDDYYCVERAEDYQKYVEARVAEALTTPIGEVPFMIEASFKQQVDQTTPFSDPFDGGACDYEGTCKVALLAPEGAREEVIGGLVDSIHEKFLLLGCGLDLEVQVYPKELPAAVATPGQKLLEDAKAIATGNSPHTYRREIKANPLVRRGAEPNMSALVKKLA